MSMGFMARDLEDTGCSVKRASSEQTTDVSGELTVSDMMLRLWNTNIQQMQQKEARTSTVRTSEHMEKDQK